MIKNVNFLLKQGQLNVSKSVIICRYGIKYFQNYFNALALMHYSLDIDFLCNTFDSVNYKLSNSVLGRCLQRVISHSSSLLTFCMNFCHR